MGSSRNFGRRVTWNRNRSLEVPFSGELAAGLDRSAGVRYEWRFRFLLD
jgi:hypothetical protein